MPDPLLDEAESLMGGGGSTAVADPLLDEAEALLGPPADTPDDIAAFHAQFEGGDQAQAIGPFSLPVNPGVMRAGVRAGNVPERVADPMVTLQRTREQVPPAEAPGAAEWTARKMPYLGTLGQAAETANAALVINRIQQNKATPADYEFAARWLNEQQRRANFTTGEQIVDLATDLPRMAVEFGTTRPIQTAVSGSVRGLIPGAVQRGAAEAAAVGTGAAVQGLAQPMFAEATARQLAGQAVEGRDQDFVEAIGKGAIESAIQTATEYSGGAFGKLPLPKQLEAVKSAITSRWAGTAAGRTVSAFNKRLEQVGWNGIVGEIGEERLADVGMYAAGLQDASQTVPTWQRIGVEAAAFAIPGTTTLAAGGAANLADRLTRPTVDAATAERALRENPQSAASLGENPTRANFAAALGVPESAVRVGQQDRARIAAAARSQLSVTGSASEVPETNDVTGERSQLRESQPPPDVPEAQASTPPGVIVDEKEGQGQAERLLESQRPNATAEPAGLRTDAAVAPQPPPGQSPTSIKNASLDQERADRGLPPLMNEAARGFGTAWDDAIAEIDTNPGIQDALVHELTAKPRAMTDRDDALLLHRLIEVKNEYDKTVRGLEDARAANNPVQTAILEAQEATLSQQRATIEEASKAGGRETARGLNARKMLAYEDFTLANMAFQARQAKGKPLTPEESTQIAELQSKVAELQKRLDDYTADADMRPLAPARRPTSAERQAAQKNVAEALKAFKVAATGKLFAGVPDVELIGAAVNVVKAYAQLGLVTFRDFYQQFSKDFGATEAAKAKETLRTAWNQIAPAEAPETAQKPRQRSENARLAATKGQMRRQTTELQGRIASGDVGTRLKRPSVTLDKEATDLRFELDKTKKRFAEMKEGFRRANRTKVGAAWEGTKEALNFSRAILTSLDFSGLGRQGGFLVAGRPAMLKHVGAMVRSFGSERAQFKAAEQIAARPNAKSGLYKRAGLELTDRESPSKNEEVYLSTLARKLPGVAGSERAYVTILNLIRADAFDAMAANLSRGGEMSDAEARIIANFVNVATGRGDLSFNSIKQMGAGLATFFFAPRYVLSRFQLLAGQPFYFGYGTGTARVRAAIAKEYAKSMIGTAVFYGLMLTALGAAAGGGDDEPKVSLDPRSSDFLKIKVGNTRIDPLYGLIQPTVLLERLRSGEKTNIKGETWPIRGNVPYGKPDAFKVIADFGRTKFSPLISGAIDLATGKTVVGDEAQPGDVLRNSLVPISLRDVQDSLEQNGLPRTAAYGLAGMLGLGIQTYGQRTPEERAKMLKQARSDAKSNQPKRKMGEPQKEYDERVDMWRLEVENARRVLQELSR